MDDQANRKRRSGLLCSKKEIILSRSLGAGNTLERKSRLAAVEAEHKMQVSGGDRKAKANFEHPTAAPVPVTYFSYSDLDRRRDEDILKRFDQEIGFDDHHAIALSGLEAKKRKLSKAAAKEFQHMFLDTEQEIIDLASTSIANLNIALKSKETSSDFVVSQSSKTSPARRRVKNTIPSDNFERYLAQIVKRYPPMTERDRVLFWKFTPELNDEENGMAERPVEGKTLRSSMPRKILENNNENPCSPPNVAYKCDDSIMFTINSNEGVKSDLFSTEDSKNKSLSPINISECRDITKNIKTYSRREPLRVYGNARQIKQKSSNRGSLETSFKIPSNPDNSLNDVVATTNRAEMSTAQKEEFYKYLGLETTSPNGKSDYIPVNVNKKRRSLRVRQMQINQEANNRVRKVKVVKSQNVKNDANQDVRKKDRVSNEIEIQPQPNEPQPREPQPREPQPREPQPREPQTKEPQAKEPQSNEPQTNEIQPIIEKVEKYVPNDRERSPSVVRRTCGSVVKSLCSERSESKSTNVLQIIERIDYSKIKNEPMFVADTPEPYRPIYSETAKLYSPVDVISDKPKPIVKYNTRMTRKNGFKVMANSDLVTKKKRSNLDPKSEALNLKNEDGSNVNINSSDKNKIPDIIELGLKLQLKHLQEKVPTVISCVEQIEYEKPVRLKEKEEIFSLIEAKVEVISKEDQSSIKSNISIIASNTDKHSVSEESLESDLLGFESSSSLNEGEVKQEGDAQDSTKSNENKTEIQPCDVDSGRKSNETYSLPDLRSNQFISTASRRTRKKRVLPRRNRKTSTISKISDKKSLKSYSLITNVSLKKSSSCNNLVESISDFQTPVKEFEGYSTELRGSPAKFDTVDKVNDNSHYRKLLRKSRMINNKYKTLLKTMQVKLNREVRRRNVMRIRAKRIKLRKLQRQTDGLNSTQPATTTTDEILTFPTSKDPDFVDSPLMNGVGGESSQEMTEDGETIVPKAYAGNALPNPLQKTSGIVLHGFYEAEMLVIVQERKVSFWKYLKVIRMFGQPQEWLFLGDQDRLLNDIEVCSPYKNRLCLNDNNPFYVEMRAKQFPDDPFRTCNMASVYVNVYYYNDAKSSVVLHSVNLDTIRGVYIDIIYTTITNSRELVMCWKQENITNTIHTGICKYSLTGELNQLASITEFKTMSYVISNLDCLGDDKLIAIGGTRVAIWEHLNGDLLADFNVMTAVGDNLGSIYCPVADYLFLYQRDVNSTTKCPQLVIMAVNLSENPLEFKIIHRHDLPQDFLNIKSSLSSEELIVVTSNNLSELLLLVQQPHRLFYGNQSGSESNTERFYSAGSQYFVEVSDESLIVKTIHEFLLDFVK